MNTKKEIKKGNDLHNLMDKFLAKLKMTKHAGEDKQSENKSWGKSVRESESPSTTELDKAQKTAWSSSKATPEQMFEFSDNLRQLLENVQALKDFALDTYDIPELNKRLEKEALELRDLYRHVRKTALDVERLKKHRYLIKKEKCSVSEKLDKLKEEEMQELESIIFAYAKPLHSKWESIKNTQKIDVVENFMNEVTGKHRAIEILQELVGRKLAKLSKKMGNSMTSIQKKSSLNASNRTHKTTTPAWNVTPASDTEKFNQTIDKMMRGQPDRDVLKMNRRKRQKLLREERRRVNHENSSSSNADSSGGLELHLVPIDHFRNEREEQEDDLSAAKPSEVTNRMNNRASPLINIELMYDTDSLGMSSTDLTLDNFTRSGTSAPQRELQREMRTVLQALFGEIQQIPQIRSRYNNNGNELRSSRTGSN